MQRLSYILFQLDEARRYIEDGRLQHLRLAVLLLDNAAELQMDRRIQADRDHDEMKERLRNQVLQIPAEQRGSRLQELVDWIPLTRAEWQRIDRYYDEKIAYMVGRGSHLDPSLADPLKHLHRYRNEAYHRGRVRPETIRTAALILLELNCHMALSLSPAARSFGSNEDYSWLEDRFGWNPWKTFFDETKLQAIIEEIRSTVLPSDASVAATLADHLRNRFEEFESALAFISENLGRHAPDQESALRESQYHAESQRTRERCAQLPRASFVPTYTMQSIELLQNRLPEVSGAATRLSAFDSFSAIERELEPIEECVHNLAVQIDMAIQAEIDRIRGK